jgi:hypothetical protein
MSAADQAQFGGELGVQDVLIQPFLSEVASAEEWSLVFLGGGTATPC